MVHCCDGHVLSSPVTELSDSEVEVRNGEIHLGEGRGFGVFHNDEKVFLTLLRQHCQMGAGELLVEDDDLSTFCFFPRWTVTDFVPSSSSSEPVSLAALGLDLRRGPVTTILPVAFLREFDIGVPTLRTTLGIGTDLRTEVLGLYQRDFIRCDCGCQFDDYDCARKSPSFQSSLDFELNSLS
jgi:hypothetical protein